MSVHALMRGCLPTSCCQRINSITRHSSLEKQFQFHLKRLPACLDLKFPFAVPFEVIGKREIEVPLVLNNRRRPKAVL